jgi:CubicO group peptidase (beta-lactamase class C family)
MRTNARRAARGAALAVLLVLAPFAASAPAPAATAPAAKAPLAGFDAWVEAERAKWNAPGVSVAVVRGDEVLLAKGFGLRDLEQKLPATGKTLFAIGSATKAFTTFAMATLVDEGKLEWHRPVRTWMPEFALKDPVASERMTPVDLVTHRSGMPRHDLLWYNADLSRAEMVSRLRELEPSKDFRTDFQYNNAMFLTAGYLVERITGKSWEDAVRERIFSPLGMTSANFSVLDSQRAPDHALPYEERDDAVKRVEFRNITNVGPAGSINASVEDLAAWMRVHLNGGMLGGKKVLDASTVADLHTPVMETGRRISPLDPDVIPGGYALGWFTDTYRGFRRVHHGGNIDGFSALVVLVPQQKVGVAVLVNTGGSGFPNVVARHALDRLLGLPPKDWSAERLAWKKQGRDVEKEGESKKATARKEGTKPAHPIAEYAGEYEHPAYGVLRVTESGGALAMTYNAISTPLEHWHYEVWNGRKIEGEKADNTFEDMRLLFRTGLSGEVEAVEAPFEPSVANVVFTRKGDARLSDPAYLARFAGTYVLGLSRLAFSVKGSELVLEVNGQKQPQLVPDRDDRFTLKGAAGFSITFVSGAAGKVAELKLVQPNGVFVAKRAE